MYLINKYATKESFLEKNIIDFVINKMDICNVWIAKYILKS